jgi:hypothetical protein
MFKYIIIIIPSKFVLITITHFFIRNPINLSFDSIIYFIQFMFPTPPIFIGIGFILIKFLFVNLQFYFNFPLLLLFPARFITIIIIFIQYFFDFNDLNFIFILLIHPFISNFHCFIIIISCINC